MPILPLSLKSADPVCIIKLFNSFVILGGLINAPAGLVMAFSLNSINFLFLLKIRLRGQF